MSYVAEILLELKRKILKPRFFPNPETEWSFCQEKFLKDEKLFPLSILFHYFFLSFPFLHLSFLYFILFPIFFLTHSTPVVSCVKGNNNRLTIRYEKILYDYETMTHSLCVRNGSLTQYKAYTCFYSVKHFKVIVNNNEF